VPYRDVVRAITYQKAELPELNAVAWGGLAGNRHATAILADDSDVPLKQNGAANVKHDDARTGLLTGPPQ